MNETNLNFLDWLEREREVMAAECVPGAPAPETLLPVLEGKPAPDEEEVLYFLREAFIALLPAVAGSKGGCISNAWEWAVTATEMFTAHGREVATAVVDTVRESSKAKQALE
jgi:hypothetical protein